MRLLRVSLPSFHDAGGLEIDFTPHRYADPPMSFLVGPNGSGKSRLLEAIGHIFGHLAAGVPPGFPFLLEYSLVGTRILITTEAERLDWPEERPRLAQVGAWLLVKEPGSQRWGPEHVQRAWPTYLDEILPFRVVGISSGPASRLQWALQDAVVGTLSLRLEAEADADRPGGRGEESELDRDVVASRLQELASQPRCFAVDAPELAFAVLALLSHSKSSRPEDEARDHILAKAGLGRDSLLAFSFEVAADWRDLLPEGEHRTFMGFTEQAVRRVGIVRTEEEVEARDLRVVYVPDTRLVEWIDQYANTAFLWFTRLQTWSKAGALRAVQLVLGVEGREGLVRDIDLSDGEFLYVGRFALMLLLRRHPECLVLLDEPETHFNDRWKVDLVDDMDRILDDTGTQIVLATHSDLTLTDADQSDVFVFDGHGEAAVTSPEAPSISPLGADRSEITQQVFGAESAVGRRAERIVADALREGGVEGLERTLQRLGPGYQRFRVRYAIEQEKEAGDDP